MTNAGNSRLSSKLLRREIAYWRQRSRVFLIVVGVLLLAQLAIFVSWRFAQSKATMALLYYFSWPLSWILYASPLLLSLWVVRTFELRRRYRDLALSPVHSGTLYASVVAPLLLVSFLLSVVCGMSGNFSIELAYYGASYHTQPTLRSYLVSLMEYSSAWALAGPACIATTLAVIIAAECSKWKYVIASAAGTAILVGSMYVPFSPGDSMGSYGDYLVVCIVLGALASLPGILYAAPRFRRLVEEK